MENTSWEKENKGDEDNSSFPRYILLLLSSPLLLELEDHRVQQLQMFYAQRCGIKAHHNGFPVTMMQLRMNSTDVINTSEGPEKKLHRVKKKKSAPPPKTVTKPHSLLIHEVKTKFMLLQITVQCARQTPLNCADQVIDTSRHQNTLLKTVWSESLS